MCVCEEQAILHLFLSAKGGESGNYGRLIPTAARVVVFRKDTLNASTSEIDVLNGRATVDDGHITNMIPCGSQLHCAELPACLGTALRSELEFCFVPSSLSVPLSVFIHWSSTARQGQYAPPCPPYPPIQVAIVLVLSVPQSR